MAFESGFNLNTKMSRMADRGASVNHLMKILFVVPYAPNLVRTRSYNLIRHLARRGNKVTVLTLWTNQAEREDLDALRSVGVEVEALFMPTWRSFWNCLTAVPTSAPFQSVYSWRPELLSGLNGRLSNEFDIAHVEHLRGSRYALAIKQQSTIPVVWDSVDCISHLFRQSAAKSKNVVGRWRSRFDLHRTERYEGWLRDQFDQVLVTSPVDQEQMSRLGENGRVPPPVSVLKNGVDLDYFTPDTAVPREPATLVISGKMSYHANITMTLRLAKEIMPRVWSRRPDVSLWVVGKDPSREVQALAEHPAITVTGTVPDIRPYLRRATMAVSPIAYGAGIQNKVLEAMACATPVVTTPQAVSALDVKIGQDVLAEEDDGRLAENVLDLLADPARQQQVGQSGSRYVQKHHDWAAISAQLEEIYRSAVETHLTKLALV